MTPIDIALVVSNAGSPYPWEISLKTWLEEKDYVSSVTYEDEDDVSQATLNTYDLVVLVANDAFGKCKGLSVPVFLNYSYNNYNTLKLGTGWSAATSQTHTNIVDITHYITAVFEEGALEILSSSTIYCMSGNSQDVTSLSEHVSLSSYKQLLYLEKDGKHTDESIATERMVFFGPSDPTYLTENGTTLFDRCIWWLLYPVETPTFEPASGAYVEAQDIVISCATDESTIKYTTDGSTPTPTHGTEYTEAVTISETTTLKAISYKDGMSDSDVITGTYIIGAIPPKQVCEWATPIAMEVDFETPVTKEVEFKTPITKEVEFDTPVK